MTIKYVIVLYVDNIPAGCGAIKSYDNSRMEIKRMYTKPDFRGKGVASRILRELESWSKELGVNQCILETGIHQPEAIGLYLKNKYEIVPNYGPYAGVETSKCFRKVF